MLLHAVGVHAVDVHPAFGGMVLLGDRCRGGESRHEAAGQESCDQMSRCFIHTPGIDSTRPED
jgi:hypothetical protein